MGFIYKGNKLKEISFPLGGIGTGCIGLAGNGSLIDWEIFNRPNKGSINGFSHFAVKAETEEGNVIDARVLNGDLYPPYTGKFGKPNFNSYGFGVDRATMAGVPHFEEVEFKGEFPIAVLNFIDQSFPGRVKMKSFNPFIPLNDEDSSIPGAFFEFELENIKEQSLIYTIGLSQNNPFPKGTTINEYKKYDNINLIQFKSNKFTEDETGYGELSIATDATDISYQEYWYRGKWFDNLSIFWRDFTSSGKLRNRSYFSMNQQDKTGLDTGADVGTLATHFKLKPGEKKVVKFIITWNFPNNHNYWNPEESSCDKDQCCSDSSEGEKSWKNYYATVFKNSLESAKYSLRNWDRLYDETLKFKETLFSSTLPEVAIEAISANLSTLKSPTCLRLEDGSLYGFEGCHCDSGCCEGSCTHVWNYAYATPFLFPKLERSMRDLDFQYNQRDDGGMSFRLQLPLGRERSQFRPCADGQFGGVIKAYREWKISGDTEWLKSNWSAIKKSIEYAWSDSNEDRWDLNKDGVLEGRQHHTLDMELFGPNSWLTGFYLAALKAGAEMAEYLDEKGTAEEYRILFKQGKKWVDENLFNGEYYHQIIDLKDKSVLERYNEGNTLFGDTTIGAYWNDEVEEIKYQIKDGCGIDQVLAQWHANICGLGEIFDHEQTKKALKSIYKYNFKKNMRAFFNPCRLYSLNDEAGIVICEWPEGKYKPVVPITYAEETMNGFEYQVAIHMLQEGYTDKGLEIIKSIRDRYDGEKRNPWNEFECGNNYARSMASYALLTTFSGFQYNMVHKMIGFDPIKIKDGKFKCFWSLDSGWGEFIINADKIKLIVMKGKLELQELKFPFIKDKNIKTITIEGKQLDLKLKMGVISLNETVTINEDNTLVIRLFHN